MIDPKHLDYLKMLQISQPTLEKVDQVLSDLSFLFSVSIDDIFLTDVMHDDSRDFIDLWAFTSDSWMWAQNFQQDAQEVDISPLTKSVRYIGVKYERCSFPTKFHDDSFMQIEVATDRVDYSTLLATGYNCERLFEIAKKYLLHNLTPRQ